jgi:cysteinyl-tRNA synthetase
MLEIGAAKMAKSLGNIEPLHAVLARYGRDAVILYFCAAHYRQPMDFGEVALGQAVASVERLRELARKLEPGASPPALTPLRERFFAALDDDFNTPTALAAMWEWVREANRQTGTLGDGDLRAMLDVFALANLLDAAGALAPREAVDLARERERARAGGDFARADELRAQIEALGWTVRDATGGFELLPRRDA